MEKEIVKNLRAYRLTLDPETYRMWKELAQANFRSMRGQIVAMIHQAYRELQTKTKEAL